MDRFEGTRKPKKVPCVDLNSYKFNGNIVMKLDAELSEPRVWKGMTKHIPNLKCVIMEWFNQAFVETGTDRLGILKQIRDEGFQIYDINDRKKPVNDEYLLGTGKIDVIIRR